jgi:hypothetical protein
MTDQQIVDEVEDALTSKLPIGIREKVLDAVWQVLNDELGMDLEVGGKG